MRISGRLAAVVLFAGISLLALVVSGLVDWLASSLFLALEFLAGFLRRFFGGGARPRHRSTGKARRTRGSTTRSVARPHRLARRKFRNPHATDGEPASPDPLPPVLTPKCRVLVAVSDDEPGLVTFALDECRARGAELLLLFVRPLVVTPMGPNPLPGLDEDGRASSVFERVGDEARRAGVPMRTFYEVASDRASRIVEVARALEADVLVIGATRRRGLWKSLSGDVSRSILAHLPERASLLIHPTC